MVETYMVALKGGDGIIVDAGSPEEAQTIAGGIIPADDIDYVSLILAPIKADCKGRRLRPMSTQDFQRECVA
jgi:hypothetical protein